jgi:hypothetical protein
MEKMVYGPLGISTMSRRRRPSLLRRTAKGVFIAALASGMAIGSVIGIVVSFRPEVAYAAMAVIDGSNLVKNAETSAQSAKIYSETAKTTQLLTTLRSLVGMGMSYSGGSSPFRYGSGSSGIVGASNVLRTAMPSMQRVFSNRASSINDVGSGRELVRQHLSSVDGLTPEEEHRRVLERRANLDEAQENATSVALVSMKDLSENGARRVRELSTQNEQAAGESGESAASMRAQLAANSATNIALLEEMQQMRMVQSAQLHLDSSRSILASPSTSVGNPGFKSISTGGGTKGGGLFE